MRRRPLEFYLGLWTLILVAAAGSLLLASADWFGRNAPNRPLLLKAADQVQRIRVDWDPSLSQVRAAESALLEVQDGGALHRYPVEKRVLQSGGLDYLRKSGDVLLTLTLLRAGRPEERATVRTIAPIRESPERSEVKPPTSRSRRR